MKKVISFLLAIFVNNKSTLVEFSTSFLQKVVMDIFGELAKRQAPERQNNDRDNKRLSYRK